MELGKRISDLIDKENNYKDKFVSRYKKEKMSSSLIKQFIEEINLLDNSLASLFFSRLSFLINLKKNKKLINQEDINFFYFSWFKLEVESSNFEHAVSIFFYLTKKHLENAIEELILRISRQNNSQCNRLLVFLYTKYKEQTKNAFINNIGDKKCFSLYINLLFETRRYVEGIFYLDTHLKNIIDLGTEEETLNLFEQYLLKIKNIINNHKNCFPKKEIFFRGGLFLNGCKSVKKIEKLIEQNYLLICLKKKIFESTGIKVLHIKPKEMAPLFIQNYLYDEYFSLSTMFSYQPFPLLENLSIGYSEKRNLKEKEFVCLLKNGIYPKEKTPSECLSILLSIYLKKSNNELSLLKYVAQTILENFSELPGWLERILLKKVPDRLLSLYLNTNNYDKACDICFFLIHKEILFIKNTKRQRFFPYKHLIEKTIATKHQRTEEIKEMFFKYISIMKQKGLYSYLKQM